MRRALADWAPVLGVVAASTLFLAYYLLLDMGVGGTAEMALEQGKVLWGSSSLVLNLSMMWCALVSLIVIRQFSRSFSSRERVVIFVSFGLLFVVLSCFIAASGEYAGRAAASLLEKFATSGLTGVSSIVKFNNMVGVLVVILLVLALVFVIRGVEESSARSLAGRIYWFNLLLYSGGVVLAAAVYTTYWLFQWAASLEVDPLQQRSQEIFASRVAVGGGFLFSSLLMLIVIPAAIRLDRQLKNLMQNSAETIPDFDPQKWLAKEGIESAPLHSIATYAAVLLPTATGFLTKLPGL